MGKIQLDLDSLTNQIVEIYKAINKLANKKEAIKAIIMEKKFLVSKFEDGKLVP